VVSPYFFKPANENKSKTAIPFLKTSVFLSKALYQEGLKFEQSRVCLSLLVEKGAKWWHNQTESVEKEEIEFAICSKYGLEAWNPTPADIRKVSWILKVKARGSRNFSLEMHIWTLVAFV